MRRACVDDQAALASAGDEAGSAQDREMVAYSAGADAQPPPSSVFTFVTDGIHSAVEQAKAAAGDKVVGVHGASAAQQCLAAGLLDEIQVSLAPSCSAVAPGCSSIWAASSSLSAPG